MTYYLRHKIATRKRHPVPGLMTSDNFPRHTSKRRELTPTNHPQAYKCTLAKPLPLNNSFFFFFFTTIKFQPSFKIRNYWYIFHSIYLFLMLSFRNKALPVRITAWTRESLSIQVSLSRADGSYQLYYYQKRHLRRKKWLDFPSA